MTTKLDRVIRHFDNVTSVNVILSVEKLVQKAEVTVHVRGKDLFVEAADQDLYAALDAMTDKLDRQVLKVQAEEPGPRPRRDQTSQYCRGILNSSTLLARAWVYNSRVFTTRERVPKPEGQHMRRLPERRRFASSR